MPINTIWLTLNKKVNFIFNLKPDIMEITTTKYKQCLQFGIKPNSI